VRAKIAALREATSDQAKAKKYDFEMRLKEIRAAEEKLKAERKAKRRMQRQKQAEQSALGDEPNEIMEAMGFGGFGGSKR
jgi:U4/U6.U5 tri-snRNP component SNU23